MYMYESLDCVCGPCPSLAAKEKGDGGLVYMHWYELCAMCQHVVSWAGGGHSYTSNKGRQIKGISTHLQWDHKFTLKHFTLLLVLVQTHLTVVWGGLGLVTTSPQSKRRRRKTEE